MNVPSSYIIEFIQDNFNDYQVYGDETTINSIFVPDSKKHLSINTKSGLWQDFKSGESGNFVSFVANVKKISYSAARTKIMRDLWNDPEFFVECLNSSAKHSFNKEIKKASPTFDKIEKFLDDCLQLTKPSLRTSSPDILWKFRYGDMGTTYKHCWSFLEKKRLTSLCNQFFISPDKNYKNRLIIPFMDKRGNSIFFQGRWVGPQAEKIKYKNPSSEELGVKASDILFPFDLREEYVIVVEGPLDAILLQSLGINATSIQGSSASEEQALQLKGNRTVYIALDNDNAGRKGSKKLYKLLKTKGINTLLIPNTVYYGFKDFGDMFVHPFHSSFDEEDILPFGCDLRVWELTNELSSETS